MNAVSSGDFLHSAAARDASCDSRKSSAVMRVLIADDDAALARSLSQMLRQLGHMQIRIARSASEALRVALEFRPAIIFLDIELPDRAGYEVARLLHQHAGLQQMRLVALTDSGEHPAREHARAVGFERYLVKPIIRTAVQEVLEALL